MGKGELTTGDMWEPGGTKLVPRLSFTEGWTWIKKDTGAIKPNIKVKKKRKRASPRKWRESCFNKENNLEDS